MTHKTYHCYYYFQPPPYHHHVSICIWAVLVVILVIFLLIDSCILAVTIVIIVIDSKKMPSAQLAALATKRHQVLEMIKHKACKSVVQLPEPIYFNILIRSMKDRLSKSFCISSYYLTNVFSGTMVEQKSGFWLVNSYQPNRKWSGEIIVDWMLFEPTLETSKHHAFPLSFLLENDLFQ